MMSLDVDKLDPQDRRTLLRTLLTGRAAATSARPQPRLTVDSKHRHEPFPMTPIQQAYWLGRDPAYRLGGVGIHGYFELDCLDLDTQRLERAWNLTIRRHDMMRTVVLPDGRAQIVESPPAYRIAIEDFRGRSRAEQSARCEELRARLSHQVFDTSQWPLFELHALRVTERLTRLFYSEDAIHLDMASSAVVIGDWLRFYGDPDASLPPLTVSYRDYALALQELNGTDEYVRAASYWRERLPNLPDPPELPLANDRPLQMTFTRRKLELEAPSWRRLQQRAADARLTSSDVLLAVYAEVLGMWSVRRRFLLNVTIQNRLPLHEEVSSITGDFTSFTLLDVDTAAPGSFRERAARYREQLWEDLEHRQVNGVEVLRDLARQRGTAELVVPYVFTSALGTEGYRAMDELGEIVFELTQTPQVLLDQQVLESRGALILTWDAVEAAFHPGVLDGMFVELVRRLRALCEDPASWVETAIPCIPTEQRQRRTQLNATDAVIPERRLEAFFAARAAESADRVAIRDARGEMTYRALDAASSRLSRALSALLDPADGSPVAIAIPKGCAQIVAVWGILKAGRAFLPLDLSQPPARLGRILESGQCAIAVVESAQQAPHLPASIRRLPLNEVQSDPPLPERVGPPAAVSASDAAYVLFTSGSTGEPKGVVISHRSVVNRMLDVVERFAIGPDDRIFALTALHHDLSMFDVFGALAFAGGTLVMPAEEIVAAPAGWPQYLRTEAVTIWNSVPAFLEMLLAYWEIDAARGGGPLQLSLALIAGDFIPRTLPARLRLLAPRARFVSLGGPTETTIWDICYPLATLPESWSSIPYGRPMRNAQYYVLREDLSECPDWVSGELCIGGAGLSSGYVGDPALTAQRYVPHPDSGERIYLSGDRGRIRPDGLIEILGRLDSQVKLAGHRVELGEVAAALRRHPGVRQAVACLTEGEVPRLVAFVTAEVTKPQSMRDPLRPEYPVIGLAPDSSAGRGRRSARGFSAAAVPFAVLAGLLASVADVDTRAVSGRRRYPSAGASYCVAVFVHIASGRVEGIPGGLYRFDAQRGVLALCSSEFELSSTAHAPWNRSLAEQSAFALLLMADIGQLRSKYGEWARDLCLVESGYLGQLLMCTSAELGLALCPIGGLECERLQACAEVAAETVLVHTLVGGMPLPATAPVNAEPHAGPQQSQWLSAGALRDFLRSELPPHMVPAQIIVRPSLPVNRNGKVDLKRLTQSLASGETAAGHAVSEQAGSERDRPAGSPLVRPGGRSSALSREIAGMLAQITRSDSVPGDRAFHEIGATSVHLVQLHAALLARGHVLDKTDLFRYPTAQALAGFLLGEQRADGEAHDPQERLHRRRLAVRRAHEVRDVR